MTDYVIKKVVAYDGRREISISSEEESQLFIAGHSRPEFDDPDILCVKFTYHDDVDNPEEIDDSTPWFINPAYCDDPIMLHYGPEMHYNIVPEVLLITSVPLGTVIEKCHQLMKHKKYWRLSEEERLAYVQKNLN